MDRTQLLFKTLVEAYIRDGQPVGSKALVRAADLTLSSATVRNIMSVLEERGLLTSPHTSAGRVPTAQGYRLFVDQLLTVRPLAETEMSLLSQELRSDRSPRELVETASRLLSEVTAHAGIVMVPRRDLVEVRHIEFLPLGGSRILAILVFANGDVQNQIIQAARPYSDVELTQATNLLNHTFAGRNLHEIADRIVAAMREDRRAMDELMQTAMDIASQTFTRQESSDFVVRGEANLVSLAETAGTQRLRELFEAFNAKRDILHLLENCERAQGVQIFIGAESGYQVFEDLSVVTAPYEVQGQVLGRLAVIGPTRMAYERIIPVVEVTARMLGAALNAQS